MWLASGIACRARSASYEVRRWWFPARRRDPLTGLGRSDGAVPQLAKTLRHARAAVVSFDVDKMKEVDDSQGLSAGDAVLVAIAAVISMEADAEHGHAFRTGGDDFAVILSGGDRRQAEQLAARVRSRVAALTVRHPYHGNQISGFTVSAGIAIGDSADPSESDEEAAQLLDEALEQAHATKHQPT